MYTSPILIRKALYKDSEALNPNRPHVKVAYHFFGGRMSSLHQNSKLLLLLAAYAVTPLDCGSGGFQGFGYQALGFRVLAFRVVGFRVSEFSLLFLLIVGFFWL